jgi:hypothetical protein
MKWFFLYFFFQKVPKTQEKKISSTIEKSYRVSKVEYSAALPLHGHY